MIDNFFWWLAYHLPRRLVYLCFVRVATYATHKYSDVHPLSCTAEQMVDAWDTVEKAP